LRGFEITNDSVNPSHEKGGSMSQRKRILPRGWYPFNREDCKREIESYIEKWEPPDISLWIGNGGVVPHAGWYFSGKLAARVFYALSLKRRPDVVVLYGGHLGSNDVPRIVIEDTWETPMGEIKIDTNFVRKLMERIETRKESPTSGDNTIEVQLAMVKYFFPEVKLVAIRSPHSNKAKKLGEEVASLSREEGISIIAIGSTDLTHYGPNYGFLKKGVGPASVKWVKEENDREFIQRALKMDIDGLLRHAEESLSACSAGAVASAVATSKVLGSEKGFLIDYYTSYDILPDDSFVGYAGIVY